MTDSRNATRENLRLMSNEQPRLSRKRGQQRLATLNGKLVDPALRLAFWLIDQFFELNVFDEPAVKADLPAEFRPSEKTFAMVYLRSIGWEVQATDPYAVDPESIWIRQALSA